MHFACKTVGMELFDFRQKNRNNVNRFFDKLKYLVEITGSEKLDEPVRDNAVSESAQGSSRVTCKMIKK